MRRSEPQELLHAWMFRREEAGIKIAAFCIALLVHVLFLLLDLPELKSPTAARKSHHSVLVVKKYTPPPPEIREPGRSPMKKLARKIPVPDPTPDLPEPIREAEIEVQPEAYPSDTGLLIGIPQPPSASPGGAGRFGAEPVLAGVGGATMPERIEESYVKPEYPELARVARLEADIILQAVIHCDGSVGETRVLRCSQPGFGFEEAAVAAVRQWHYRPATQNGRPVNVYFTILVDFTLT